MSRWVSCVALVLGLVSSPFARAAEPGQVSKAREFALAAADDLDAKRFADALEKITKAEDLYHAPTHLLMRAEALEGLGRLAEALETYERLAAEPLGPTAPPAFRKAREEGGKQERALLARVPSLLVVVTGASEGITAAVDGKPLALATGMATRVDPGKHTLRVEASGFSTVERTIDLEERGGVVKVPVHLEVASARPVRETTPDPAEPRDTPSGGRTLFVPAMVAFGVGAASLAAGAVTGALSLGRVGDLEGICTSEGRCPPSAQAGIDEASRFGNVSTATFVVGGAAVAAGVVLLVMGKPKNLPATGRIEVEPWAGPFGAGLRGRF